MAQRRNHGAVLGVLGGTPSRHASGSLSTPGNLPELLQARRLRCQKYFPAMLRPLADASPGRALPAGLEIRGPTELFIGSQSAAIQGLSVLDGYEGRGIGSVLIEHGCSDAVRSGASTMVLLATTEGQRLYERRGFSEVGRFGYRYRSFQRVC